VALRIIFTEPASADIRETFNYLRRRNPVAAHAIVRGIYQRTRVLLDHPESGSHLGGDYDLELRKLVYRSWLIAYRFVPEKQEIVILRVWHAARGPIEFADESH
jgi:plasmid stabilization system protein ParE